VCITRADLDLCSRGLKGADCRPRHWPLGEARAVGQQPATSVPAPRSRSMMTKRVTQAKSNQTMLVLLAAIGIVGLLVARRHGVQHVLRTVNQVLGIARVVRTARPSTARPTRRAANAQSPAQGDGLLEAEIESLPEPKSDSLKRFNRGACANVCGQSDASPGIRKVSRPREIPKVACDRCFPLPALATTTSSGMNAKGSYRMVG